MLLSVVVLTFNEEKNIARCLEQVQDLADELIIIDSGSTDRTVQIAEGMGAKVYVRALNGDFAAQRNFALEKAQSEYIFYLDADEFVTPELALVIQEFVRAGKKEVYSIKRRNIAFGEKVNHGVLAPDYVPRIFPKDSAKWEGKVHERPVYNLSTVKMDGFVWHETYSDWENYWMKFNKYTKIWAQEAYERGKRTNIVGCFTHAIGAFLKVFISKTGCLDGFIGWVLCFNHFAYTLAKYTRLYSLQKKDGDNK